MDEDADFEGVELLNRKQPVTPEQGRVLVAGAIETSNTRHPHRLSFFHFFLADFPVLPRYVQLRLQELDIRRNYLSQADFGRAEEQSETEQASSSLLGMARPPSSLVVWPALTALYLGANEFLELPNLSSMPNLTSLVANHNRITAITGLEHVPKLKVLDLRANKIHTLENLTAVPELERLSLSCNSLRSIRTETIPLLPRLAFLSLFGNLIEDIEELCAFLAKTPNVKKVIVAGNLFFSTASDSPPEFVVARVKSVVPTVEWIDWTYFPGAGDTSVGRGERGYAAEASAVVSF